MAIEFFFQGKTTDGTQPPDPRIMYSVCDPPTRRFAEVQWTELTEEDFRARPDSSTMTILNASFSTTTMRETGTRSESSNATINTNHERPPLLDWTCFTDETPSEASTTAGDPQRDLEADSTSFDADGQSRPASEGRYDGQTKSAEDRERDGYSWDTNSASKVPC
ncbi:hypothetical protein BCR39DRAFT_531143 [Naematelia encephala]|uniref:Uncharacterized protein n=1 Tax=Naematelia encephala TaxID=71784 RepID=A0A1Y2B4R8_9TREE|nr:hypothetical protein BCR39DRAFT_531143 [Naematelia encephala]